MDDGVILALKVKLAKIMEQIFPTTHRDYITIDKNGKKIIYVKHQRELYGCLRSALQFYRKLRKELEKYSFVIIPYDPCVSNRIINGRQMTVVWHVDNIKIPHKDPKEVTKLINYLEYFYGEMTVSIGNTHSCLRMELGYSTPG